MKECAYFSTMLFKNNLSRLVFVSSLTHDWPTLRTSLKFVATLNWADSLMRRNLDIAIIMPSHVLITAVSIRTLLGAIPSIFSPTSLAMAFDNPSMVLFARIVAFVPPQQNITLGGFII